MWIMGDRFCSDTCKKYLLNMPEEECCVRQNYEISAFFTQVPHNRDDYGAEGICSNILARLYNCMVSTMHREATVPKMVIMVIESDIIDFLSYDDYGISVMFGKIINNIAKEIKNVAYKFKSKYLQRKTTKPNWPQFIWVIPSTHVNYPNNTLRHKFGAEMEKRLDYHQDSHTFKIPRHD